MESNRAWVAQRVAILIDVQNIYYGAKFNFDDRKVAYKKLIDAISKDRDVVRVIAYIVEKSNSQQDSFIGLMKKIGCDVKIKKLIERDDGSKKGNWDIAMAVDAMVLSEKVDSIVLVTGDGDFSYLADVLRARGIRVEVMAVRNSTAKNLIHSVDEYREITEDFMRDEHIEENPYDLDVVEMF